MLINKKAKIERVLKDAVEDDAALVVYAGGEDGILPQFDTAFGRVTAMGRHVIVSVPCTIQDGDVPGPVQGEALTYARQHTDLLTGGKTAAHVLLDERRLVADNGTVFIRAGAVVDGEHEGLRLVANDDDGLKFELTSLKDAETPPDAADLESPLRDDGTYKVGPNLDMLRGSFVSSAVKAVVRLNPELLKMLADAMGSAAAVQLTIYEDANVVRVDVGSECELEGAFGYLATIRED